MHLFLIAVVPIALILAIWGMRSYLRLRRPSPLALGSAFPKLCVVSADEIQSYYEADEQADLPGHLRHESASKQLKVSGQFVGQMAGNAKLILQVMQFEKLKISPNKSSLAYEHREMLTLRLAEESSQIHWFLVKAQVGLAFRSCVGARLSRQAMKNMLLDYKQLEQDFVALVQMAADESYYTMLIDRLGLSNWRLFDGGSPAA